MESTPKLAEVVFVFLSIIIKLRALASISSVEQAPEIWKLAERTLPFTLECLTPHECYLTEGAESCLSSVLYQKLCCLAATGHHGRILGMLWSLLTLSECHWHQLLLLRLHLCRECKSVWTGKPGRWEMPCSSSSGSSQGLLVQSAQRRGSSFLSCPTGKPASSSCSISADIFPAPLWFSMLPGLYINKELF
ncbi:Hypothetical predicted protein [Podarcis lilfordi]|uniref:Secreted protein n=1 Tax=Podarcis lilfordi TaxID=74358 RepID=A0AA35KPH3_9SAUR|nr:Hypothetical predicted protein [Podarcis lilfordi]